MEARHRAPRQALQLPVIVTYKNMRGNYTARLYLVKSEPRCCEYVQLIGYRGVNETKPIVNQCFRKLSDCSTYISGNRRSDWSQWVLDGTDVPISIFREGVASSSVYHGPGFINPTWIHFQGTLYTENALEILLENLVQRSSNLRTHGTAVVREPPAALTMNQTTTSVTQVQTTASPSISDTTPGTYSFKKTERKKEVKGRLKKKRTRKIPPSSKRPPPIQSKRTKPTTPSTGELKLHSEISTANESISWLSGVHVPSKRNDDLLQTSLTCNMQRKESKVASSQTIITVSSPPVSELPFDDADFLELLAVPLLPNPLSPLGTLGTAEEEFVFGGG